MINRFFEQVGGIIRVRLQGKNLEKIINMALSRGIFINDIKHKEDGLHFKVRSSAFQALQNISDEHGYKIEVIDKQGLPFYQALLKRRLGFVTGALIFVISLYLLSSFVWFINVTGCKQVNADQIILTAARYGIYQGAAKWNFSRSEAEQGILRDIDQLSYVRIDIRGVKANIEVVEKILPRTEITGPCHLVAARDGVVEQVLVLDGQANVAEGEVVAQGEILISGVVFPQPSPFLIPAPGSEAGQESHMPYVVRARGQVKARVWYEGYGECQLVEERLLPGRETKRYYLETPWKKITLKSGSPASFNLAKEHDTRKTLHTPLGKIVFHKILVCEQIKQVTERTESQAVKIARERATQTLRKKLGPGHRFTDSKVEVLSSPSDPIIRVKISAETIEDIAVPEPISGVENSQR